MADKEKILAEIERRKKEAYGNEWGWAVQCATYDEILSFINSIPEEPVSEGLEDAAGKHVKEYFDMLGIKVDDNPVEAGKAILDFKAGAQWQKKVFISKACDWLTKHAKKYYFNKKGYLGTDELVEDFKLIMEM